MKPITTITPVSLTTLLKKGSAATEIAKMMKGTKNTKNSGTFLSSPVEKIVSSGISRFIYFFLN
jgi:hypothetical protein